MKKIMRILSMVALAIVSAITTSCSSDDNIIKPQQPENKTGVVTLTTTVSMGDGGAATRALTPEGVKTFAVGEKMALVYRKTDLVEVKAVSNALAAGDISNGGKTATFTFTVTDPDKSYIVYYYYPAAMINDDGTPNNDALFTAQDGTLTTLEKNFDFCMNSAKWAGDNLPSLTLENRLAILAITLKDNAATPNDITSTITSLTLSENEKNYTYTINRSATAGPIYVAISPTISANIKITATDGMRYYTKTLTGKTYAKGNGYNVSWRMTALPAGALPGKFTINDSGGKVYFSKGNLRYASSTWNFFDHQYDYYNTYSEDAWDHFGWSTSATTYGMSTSQSNGDYSGDFKDWGTLAITNGGNAANSGWRTLTSDEWKYLVNTRASGSSVFGTENACYTQATINTDDTGVNGVILFPDGVTITADKVSTAGTVNGTSEWATKCTSAQWTSLESAGCVFLPAAGYRKGSSVNGAGSTGYYWSGTACGTGFAYRVYLNSGHLNPANNYIDCYDGYSVRLVRSAE